MKMLTGIVVFFFAVYAFMRLPAWIQDVSIAEAIRIGLFGGLVMFSLCLVGMLMKASGANNKAIYYHNLSTELISNHIRHAAHQMFSLHLCENDHFQVLINVYMPNALVNATVRVNELEYEIAPFYYFKNDWWDNLEDARLQFVHQRNEL